MLIYSYITTSYLILQTSELATLTEQSLARQVLHS